MINSYIRKDLQNLKPYHSPAVPYEIKLDANESPFSLPVKVKHQLIEWIEKEENLNRYPDTDSNDLRRAIGKLWNVEEDNVICGVGSDQLIDCMMKVFLEPNDQILLPSPSFTMYSLSARMNHGIPIEVPLEENYHYSTSKILEAYAKYKPKIIVLCTPNNPTGNQLSIGGIEEIVSKVTCPVLIDEAYGEFMDDSMIDFIHKYPHIFVIRTFSKAFGLAGLRVGYGIGSKEMIDAISITKPPYNLNTLSEKIVLMALEQIPLYEERIKALQKEKDWLASQLIDIGYKVYPSKANFLLIEIKNKSISKIFQQKNILVRDFSNHPGLLSCFRVTIGTREENQKIFQVLKENLLS